MSIIKSQNARVMSEEAIQYLCKCINLVNSLPTSVIDNLHLADNLTFSSTKIDSLLTILKEDCNKYTDSIVANLSRLELKVVTDEADMIEHNKLYLIKKTGETSYSQYVIVTNDSGVDEKILLGTCDISMTDYLKITDAVATYCKKTDFDTLKTEVDKVKTTLGNETLTTTSQNVTGAINELNDKSTMVTLTQAEYNQLVADGKVDNDTYYIISDDSENLDLNKFNIKTYTRLEQIGLSSGCTVEEIYSTLPNDSYFECGTNTTYDNTPLYVINNLPNQKGGLLTIRKSSKNVRNTIEYRTTNGGGIMTDLYIAQFKGYDSSGLSWRRVCTTSVADVGKTNITSRLVNATGGEVVYSVKNGMCYVQFSGVTTTTTSTGKYILSPGTLPPMDNSLSNGHYPVADGSSTNGLVVVESGTCGVRYYGGAMGMFTTISYPVKES